MLELENDFVLEFKNQNYISINKYDFSTPSYLSWNYAQTKQKSSVQPFSEKPIDEKIDILHKILMATRLDLYSLANKVSTIGTNNIADIVEEVSERLSPRILSIIDEYLDTIIDVDDEVIYDCYDDEDDDEGEGLYLK